LWWLAAEVVAVVVATDQQVNHNKDIPVQDKFMDYKAKTEVVVMVVAVVAVLADT
jgi:hypothetical protein